ncbi:MAG: hypothetical protein H7X80_08115, partial [bacterium]|nr:hypothetical protein [Candidatus Kapabacteria bacterium]
SRTEVVDKDETITIHGRQKIVTEFSALQDAIQNENRLRKPTFNCNRTGSPEALCAREAGSGNATGVLMETVTVFVPSTSRH